MFEIRCGCDGHDRDEILSWFRGISAVAKANLMVQIEVVKTNGLGVETALPLLRGSYEPHVVELQESKHYFLLARNIADNQIIVLGRAEMSHGFEYASDKAVAATKRFFGL